MSLTYLCTRIAVIMWVFIIILYLHLCTYVYSIHNKHLVTLHLRYLMAAQQHIPQELWCLRSESEVLCSGGGEGLLLLFISKHYCR